MSNGFLGIQPPADGWTQPEKIILRTVLVSLYDKLDDLKDKFILMATYESSYTQEAIGEMLGISQVAVNKRLKKALKLLQKHRTEFGYESSNPNLE